MKEILGKTLLVLAISLLTFVLTTVIIFACLNAGIWLVNMVIAKPLIITVKQKWIISLVLALVRWVFS